MPYCITDFEATPNPNAVKCWLDQPISDCPRSFLNAEMAVGDPVAEALFQEAGVTTVLFNGDWLTVNKPPDAEWATVKSAVISCLCAPLCSAWFVWNDRTIVN